MLLSPKKGEEQSMVATALTTARLIWLCTCVRCWAYRGAGTVL